MSLDFRALVAVAAPVALAGCFSRIPLEPADGPGSPGDTGTTGEDTGDPGEDTGQPVPRIAVSPPTVDFGTVAPGCEAAEVITVENVGAADLSVDAIRLDGDATDDSDFEIAVPSGGPWVLGPGEALAATVSFRPTDPGDASGALVVTSDDPEAAAVTVELLGSGAAPTEASDTFTQAVEDDAEVIFAVDTSGSMFDDLQGFVAAFPSFLSGLDEAGVDVHVALVPFGQRCALSGAVDPWFEPDVATGVLTDILESLLEHDGSTGWGDDESAFVTWSEAWDRSGKNECNEGLFAGDRDLNLVGISDEADSKASSWADYVADFQSVDPGVRFHAIGGPSSTACGGVAYYAGLWDAVDATGGAFLSICDDWWSNFSDLADAVVAGTLADTFPLSAQPEADTIEVEVGGVAASGWSYDASLNAVVFDAEAVPPLGAEVRVRYQVAASCD